MQPRMLQGKMSLKDYGKAVLASGSDSSWLWPVRV